jgi:hypothetical protein
MASSFVFNLEPNLEEKALRFGSFLSNMEVQVEKEIT